MLQNSSFLNLKGIFHFRFFLMGFWTDVVIDDYLPFNEDNKLVFAQNNLNSNQLWIALLEKAFAKYLIINYIINFI